MPGAPFTVDCVFLLCGRSVSRPVQRWLLGLEIRCHNKVGRFSLVTNHDHICLLLSWSVLQGESSCCVSGAFVLCSRYSHPARAL